MKKTFPNKIMTFLLPLSAILMEVFWGYPWLIWTGKWETLHWEVPPLSGFAVLCLVGISFLVTRLLIDRSWLPLVKRMIIAGIGLCVVFLIIRIEYGEGYELFSGTWFVDMGKTILNSFSNFNSIVLALPAAAYFWWRGMLLGRKREYNYIRSNVIFGAGSFVVLGMVWWATMGMSTFREMANAIGIYVAAFFFFGLMSAALNNLLNVQKRMKVEETQTISYGRWIPLVAVLMGIVIAIGGLIASITSLNIADYIKRFWSMISSFMQTVIFPFLAIIFKYILMPFEWIAQNIFEWLLRTFGTKPLQPQGEEDAGDLQPEILPGITPEEWLTIIKWALFIIVVIVVTILIARSVEKNRRRQTERGPELEESRESLWSWRLVFIGFVQFFIRIFRHFLPKKVDKKVISGTLSSSYTMPSATTLKIREVFKHLLRDASKAGIGRRRNETPYEYTKRFVKEIPDATIPMRELTELYVNVRYSDTDARNDQIIHANSLWNQIKEQLKRLKSGNN